MPTLSTKPKKPPLYGKWIIIIGLAATGAFLGYWLLKPKDTPPDYLTAQAQIGDIENTVMASGKVKPAQSVDVGASVSGTITKLYVQVGDEVKKGDLIAQISQIEQKNNVANAQATLDQAKASFAQAQSTLLSSQGNIASANATLNARISELAKAQQHFERLQGLLTIDAISRQDYDDAAASLQIAKANVQVAKTALQNEQGKYRVRVIGSDGFAEPIPVTIGLNNRVNVEIKSGLKAGDTVVIGEGTNSKPSKPNSRNRPPML